MRWSPGSWRAFEARQQPSYPDSAANEAVLAALAPCPPLVDLAAIDALTARLAAAQAGRAFLLQAGDCAELLSDNSAGIRAMIGLIEGLAADIREAAGLDAIPLGRIAGQFAKPRSIAIERRGETALPAWRGDSVNAMAFDADARTADPARLLAARDHAARTMTLLGSPPSLFTSHEALLLPAEQAQLRRDPATGRWFAGSAHFLWIGARTLFPKSAHVEFARGIANPLGLKCGAELAADDLGRILGQLDPDHEPGRITLILRVGRERIADRLPPLARAVEASGHPVLWCCDPMHGNTVRAADGTKHRAMAAVEAETHAFFSIAHQLGIRPAGLHLELTPRAVAECDDGARTGAADRGECRDPRLNPDQARRIVRLAASALASRRTPAPA